MAVRQSDVAIQQSGTSVKRRGILAAASAVVAGVVAKQVTAPVAANTGASFIVGQSPTTLLFNNFAQNPTALTYNGTNANLSGHNILTVHEGTAGVTASTNPAALAGVAGPTTQTGVLGIATVSGSVGVRGIFGPGGFGFTGDVGVLGEGGVGSGSTGVIGVGGGDGVVGFGFGAGNANGVVGVGFNNGYGGVFTGSFAPLQLTPAKVGTGHPASGAHLAGELYVDSAGSLFYCKSAGSPGTWVTLGTTPASIPVFTALPTPERFVDTRINLGGVLGPVLANGTHTFQMTSRNGQSGNAALQIPDSATIIVGNLTVVGGVGIAAGSFVTLWPGGPQPTVSNINVGPGQVIANSYVVGLTSNNGHGIVSVYNQEVCDYILDVTGYYVSTPSASRATTRP